MTFFRIQFSIQREVQKRAPDEDKCRATKRQRNLLTESEFQSAIV